MLENFVMKTPILFFMFNRPHYAIQVFKKIRQIKPPKLFIAVEGPRPDRPDDIEKVQQCRDICKLVDWDCELYTNFAEVDMGCKDHIASRISWAFEYVDELIMMEDDRIPSLSFFPYCQELLEKYPWLNDSKEQMLDIARRKNWHLCLGYAVQMPNTYVCLPGFDVDADDLEKSKLTKSKVKLEEIVVHLQNYDKGCFDTLPGGLAWLKSAVIRPLFNKCLITAKPFHVTDGCIHCGRCERECPMKNIKLSTEDSMPKWGQKCVGCLRCYHLCPSNSVQFGTFTKGKGQYCYKK